MNRDPLILARVKKILGALTDMAPGHAVEVRIPPYSAIQCIEGPRHTRGTPPNVVEMQADALFALIEGSKSWAELAGNGAIHASGERSDLSEIFQSLANRMRS